MHLPRHICASVGRIARKPVRSIGIRFLHICRTICCYQVLGVVRELTTFFLANILSPGLPRIRKRHHMVDLNGT